ITVPPKRVATCWAAAASPRTSFEVKPSSAVLTILRSKSSGRTTVPETSCAEPACSGAATSAPGSGLETPTALPSTALPPSDGGASPPLEQAPGANASINSNPIVQYFPSGQILVRDISPPSAWDTSTAYTRATPHRFRGGSGKGHTFQAMT